MSAAHELNRAREALGHIPPDLPRDEWVRAGMAAQAAGLDFDAFDSWSAQAASYDSRAARDTWRSFKPGKGVGAGTLYRMATEHGWRDDAKPTRQAQPSPAASPRRPRKPRAQVAPCRCVGALRASYSTACVHRAQGRPGRAARSAARVAPG
ncbi:PriCT-2 domain-containing protein [Ottowia beijingensis]|uniref:PriCT-2 domain-containing protein n=1 Tax=Ottowia beijingensis TaxID=1207057 RepID=A0A853ISM2_9BURK|nr:PriCT-2 domain-containing protein [Ottowia beijingensis]NZA00581.1 PriCT-2 domain-containing protein [Ottowia beijingensis]